MRRFCSVLSVVVAGGLLGVGCGPKEGAGTARPTARPSSPRRTEASPRREAKRPPGTVTNAMLRAAIKKTPSKAVLHFTLALRLHKAGQVDQAINFYRNAAAVKPDYFEPRFNLGVIYQTRQQWAKAATWFGRAAEASPTHFIARFNQALCLIRSGQLEAAERELAALVKLNKEIGRIHYLRGVVLLRRGKRFGAQALRSFRNAVKAGHGTADVHARIGTLLMKRRRTKQAVIAFKAALLKTPNHGLASANLGAILLRQGTYAEAIPHLRRAAQVHPKSASVLINLGLALLRDKKYLEAVLPLGRAHGLKPDLPLGQITYGVALLFEGKTRQGAKLIGKAVGTKRRMAGLLGGYVQPLVEHKKLDGAIALLEAIVVAEPRNRVARKNLKILLKRRGR